MNKFSELDECLSKDYSINYWSDDVILYAIKLIQNFSPADWDYLETVWMNKTFSWQDYLAQILPWGDSDKAVPLLLKLLSVDDSVDDEEVVSSAADSLREIQDNNQF